MANPNPDPAEREAERQRRSEAHASQTYARFLNEFARLANLSAIDAERAAAAVLCILEQRLFPTRALKLESQLPVRLVDLVTGCEAHGPSKGEEKIGAEEFIERVAAHLGEDRTHAESLVRQVFIALRAQISAGEAEKVASQLPADLQAIWNEPA